MKYDLSTPILDSKGEQQKDDVSAEPITLRHAFERALLGDWTPNLGHPVSPSEKNKRFKLWRKIQKANGELECTVDEANTLKECVGGFPTVFYGQILEILDGGN